MFDDNCNATGRCTFVKRYLTRGDVTIIVISVNNICFDSGRFANIVCVAVSNTCLLALGGAYCSVHLNVLMLCIIEWAMNILVSTFVNTNVLHLSVLFLSRYKRIERPQMILSMVSTGRSLPTIHVLSPI